MARNLIAEQAALGAAQESTDAVVPGRNVSGISGAEQRLPVDGLSKLEHRNRAYRARAQRVGSGEHTRAGNRTDRTPGRERGKPGRRMRRKMSVGLLTEMTEDILGLTHGIAMSDDYREVERKYATTSYSIALDKWLILTGRPTQIIQVGEAEVRRPAVNRLAAKVVRLVQPQNDAKSA